MVSLHTHVFGWHTWPVSVVVSASFFSFIFSSPSPPTTPEVAGDRGTRLFQPVEFAHRFGLQYPGYSIRRPLYNRRLYNPRLQYLSYNIDRVTIPRLQYNTVFFALKKKGVPRPRANLPGLQYAGYSSSISASIASASSAN